MNSASVRPTIADYLALQYRLDVIPDPDGGFVLTYPDLPGCISQVDSLSEVGEVAEEVRRLWLETAYEQGVDIPLPSQPEEHSGKFNLRLPKSLHRRLAEGADRDDVSLNQYVVGLLSEGVATSSLLAELRAMHAAQEQMRLDLATLATQVEDVRAHMTTYTTERRSTSRQRAGGSAATPANVRLFGAVAA